MALAFLLATLPGARPALAADFVVTSTGDSGPGTLRAAVTDANASAGADTITFDPSLAGQTIELSTVGDNSLGASALVVTSEITIEGLNGDDGVTIARDATAPNLRLFYVGPGGDLTLKNLTLKDGVARGGNGGTGFYGGGGAAGLGGAIFNRGTLDLYASTLTENSARGGNGGDACFCDEMAGGGGLGGKGGDGFGWVPGNGGPRTVAAAATVGTAGTVAAAVPETGRATAVASAAAALVITAVMAASAAAAALLTRAGGTPLELAASAAAAAAPRSAAAAPPGWAARSSTTAAR